MLVSYGIVTIVGGFGLYMLGRAVVRSWREGECPGCGVAKWCRNRCAEREEAGPSKQR